jgi:ABC-type proline/glycine betaine transport system ATPase subunit
VLRNGRIAQVGTPAELVTSPADDYVERLLDAPRRQARALSELAGGTV